MSREGTPVNVPFPGRRAKKVERTAFSSALIILSILGTLSPLIPEMVKALSNSPSSIANPKIDASADVAGSQVPRTVGAEQVPDLSFPRTVLSNVDNLIGSGGVIQTSPDNITLYNPAIAFRLRGGPTSHDELLSPSRGVFSSWSSWGVEAQIANGWASLAPRSNNFTVIDTNSSGTYVVRQTLVKSASLSGTLKVVYTATRAGPLKWDLEFEAATTGHYRLVYSWHNLTRTFNLSAMSAQIQVSYGAVDYTLSWADVPRSLNSTAIVSQGRFFLSIDLGAMALGSTVHIDPTISSNVGPKGTAFTFQRHVFYEPNGGKYWVFYNNGSAVVYRYSGTGSAWSASYSIPNWPAWTGVDSSSPAVYNSGQVVVVASGSRTSGTAPSGWTASASVYYAVGTISGSTIS